MRFNFWRGQDLQTIPRGANQLQSKWAGFAARQFVFGRRVAHTVRLAPVLSIFFFAASIFLTPPAQAEVTESSWYGDECKGKPMANGKPFNPSALTCASWDYPLGTKLRVTHGKRFVVVMVTDRGPAKRLYKQGRKLDLSREAFRRLAPLKLGLIRVDIVRATENR
jgi:rare lipoprotein A